MSVTFQLTLACKIQKQNDVTFPALYVYDNIGYTHRKTTDSTTSVSGVPAAHPGVKDVTCKTDSGLDIVLCR